MAAFISYLRKDKKVLEISNTCVSCTICAKKCPMGISPYEYKGNALNHQDCIQCAKGTTNEKYKFVVLLYSIKVYTTIYKI